MAEDRIRYDILVQDALRGVVRKVLSEVAQTGLPGEHHFYISFLTTAPGVRISSRLKERYPEQMTIVLQHQYWELKVGDTGFEVGLSFGDAPEKLSVPFSAIRGFYDPTASFEVEFEDARKAQTPENEAPDAPSEPAETEPQASASDDKAVAPGEEGDADKASEAEGDKGAEVVSLDAFRKK